MELQLNKADWRPTRFGEIAIQKKVTIDRETTDLTRYVKGEHMSTEDVHLRSWGDLTDEYLGPAFTRRFDEGDILYGSRRTYLKKVTIAPFSGITSNTTFVVNANTDVIDERLLPWIMLSEGFTEHSIRNSKGSVNPYINWKDLANYEFLLPPKEQQAELAELLWAMDDTYNSRIEIIEKARIHLKSRFEDQIRNAKESIPLSQMGQIVTGATPSTKKESYWSNGKAMFLTPGDYGDDLFLKTSQRTISDEGLATVREIPRGAVCVVCIGATIGKIGISDASGATNQQINAIIPNENFASEYIALALRFFKNRILARSAATTLPIINKREFGKVKIPKLTVSETHSLVNAIHAFETLKNSIKLDQSNFLRLRSAICELVFPR